MSGPIEIRWKQGDLERLRQVLDPDHKAYAQLVEDCLTELALRAIEPVMAATPVVTGNLRRSVQATTDKVRASPPESAVESRAIYAGWIETGQTKDGSRRMKHPAGGYRMFEAGYRYAEGIVDSVVDRAIDRARGTLDI